MPEPVCIPFAYYTGEGEGAGEGEGEGEGEGKGLTADAQLRQVDCAATVHGRVALQVEGGAQRGVCLDDVE